MPTLHQLGAAGELVAFHIGEDQLHRPDAGDNFVIRLDVDPGALPLVGPDAPDRRRLAQQVRIQARRLAQVVFVRVREGGGA